MKVRMVATVLAVGSAMVLGSPDFANADNGNHYGQKNGNNGNNGSVSGAPAPIAGAGLPILAVGFGVYWLIRRRRKQDQ